MNGVPGHIDVRNFVSEKFNRVESDGNPKNPRMRKNFQRRRKMNDAESLEQAKRGDGGVQVEARGKSGAKRKAKSLQRVHAAMIARRNRFDAE